MHREESQELQGKGTGDSTAVQAAAGQGHTCLSPSPGSPPGALGCFGKQLLEQPWSLPGLPGMLFCNARSCSHQVWDRPSLPRACHCPCHPPPSTQPEWFSLPSCPRLAGSEGREREGKGRRGSGPPPQRGQGDGGGVAVGSPHWQSPNPWPAGAAPWPGSQRESKVRARWQNTRYRQQRLPAGTPSISCHWTPWQRDAGIRDAPPGPRSRRASARCARGGEGTG